MSIMLMSLKKMHLQIRYFSLFFFSLSAFPSFDEEEATNIHCASSGLLMKSFPLNRKTNMHRENKEILAIIIRRPHLPLQRR